MMVNLDICVEVERDVFYGKTRNSWFSNYVWKEM